MSERAFLQATLCVLAGLLAGWSLTVITTRTTSGRAVVRWADNRLTSYSDRAIN